MTVKSAEALSALDQFEAFEKQAQVELDSFIDGVDSMAKEAGIVGEDYARMWAAIGDSLEKFAASTPEGVQALSQALEKPEAPTVGALAPTTAATTAPPETGKRPMNPVNWGSGNTWGKALGGAAIGGLGSLLATGLMGNRDAQGNKHYIRNALLGALAGGVGAPYLSKWMAAGGPQQAGDWLKNKWQGASNWMAGKLPAAKAGA